MPIQICANAEEVAEGCDALVLITEWNEYRDLDWEVIASKMRSPFLLDGRHALDREKVTRSGMKYVTIN